MTGVDIDPGMLATAREKAPDTTWLIDGPCGCGCRRTFDAVVMAGNVMIFLAPGSEGAVVANMARHLHEGGVLIAGFQLQTGRLDLERYDEMADAAGLALESRYATWDREPWVEGGNYAVSVHRKAHA